MDIINPENTKQKQIIYEKNIIKRLFNFLEKKVGKDFADRINDDMMWLTPKQIKAMFDAVPTQYYPSLISFYNIEINKITNGEKPTQEQAVKTWQLAVNLTLDYIKYRNEIKKFN